MNRKYIICIIFFINGFFIYATGQFPDILLWNGNEYRITANYPMQDYFINFPEKRFPSGGSALQRGYIATYEILNNELWLIDIKIPNGNYSIINGNFIIGYTSIINEFLNDIDRTKIDWFNGFLILPQGEIIGYEQVGYEASFEYYIIIEFQNGNLIKYFNIDFEQYKEFFEINIQDIYWKGFSR